MFASLVYTQHKAATWAAWSKRMTKIINPNGAQRRICGGSEPLGKLDSAWTDSIYNLASEREKNHFDTVGEFLQWIETRMQSKVIDIQ